ncbi:MAG: aminotransferase class IV [Pseudomonadota bacterium]
MARISFLNQEFLPHNQCFVHIEDRGFQFADGVYEVILWKNNKLIDSDWHLQRLFRSLGELEIQFNQTKEQLEKIIFELFAKNNLSDGSVYLQITRGVAPRQPFLPQDCFATICATVLPLKDIDLTKGLNVITHQDIRWQRCDIKSIALLASSWIRQKAFDLEVDDAILVRDGFITEATFANVFIVDEENNLRTHQADNFVLCGITRNRIIDLAKKNGITVLEQKFTVQEMLQAKEVFLSSTTLFVRPVVKIDEQIIGDGKVGKISHKLLDLYQNFIN